MKSVTVEHGPMLLEANARPGLAIQIANASGLLSRLAEIDSQVESGKALAQRRRHKRAEPARQAA